MLVERFAYLCCKVDIVHAQTGNTLMLVVRSYLYLAIGTYICTTVFVVKKFTFSPHNTFRSKSSREISIRVRISTMSVWKMPVL